MAKCFTEVTHVSLKYLQYFTATGSLTYILGAFRVLRSVLFVQDNADSDLRVRLKKKKEKTSLWKQEWRRSTSAVCEEMPSTVDTAYHKDRPFKHEN